MAGIGKRVICKEFGAGEIISFGRFGQMDIAFVRFDGSDLDGTFVLVEDLKPELDKNDKENDNDIMIKYKGRNKEKSEINDNVSDAERRLAHEKEMERIRTDGLALAKEIGDMSNETLVEEFESLIRNGAGSGYRGVIFMKREMLRRMGRGDHL